MLCSFFDTLLLLLLTLMVDFGHQNYIKKYKVIKLKKKMVIKLTL